MNAVVGLTPEQHAARSQGVGASEVYDALFNPIPLWMVKTGRMARGDDDALSRLGNAIEPYILDEYERETGLGTIRKPDTVRRGRMVAHLDATTVHDVVSAAVEAKWRGHRDGWGEAGSADVPQKILLQVMAQMHVANLVRADVPVLFLRPPIAIYRVPYDAEFGAMLEAGVERFWWHVEHDTAPAVNPDAPEAIDVLRKLYTGTNGKRVSASREIEHWRSVCQQADEKSKSYETVAKHARAHLLAFMGEAAELEFADGTLLRRKVVKRKGYTVESTEYVDCRFTNPKE